MLKAHPYEEVAYDLYPMDLKGRRLVLGRVGKLSEPTKLSELTERAKTAFDVPAVRVVGDPERAHSQSGRAGRRGREIYSSCHVCWR